MGIMDKVMKAMTPEGVGTVEAAAKHMTWEQIEEYEAKGVDMSEYREVKERLEQEKERAAAEIENAHASTIDMSKLDRYKSTPRIEDEFLTGVCESYGLNKKKINQAAEAPLVYATIVQANSDLFKPGKRKRLPAVVVFSTNPEHYYNVELLSRVANKISDLSDLVREPKLKLNIGIIDSIIYSIHKKRNPEGLPEDCKKLLRTLYDSQSIFCFPVGESICDGETGIWCATYTFEKQEELPASCLTSNSVVPFLIKSELKENRIADLMLIPAQFYSK